jgi:hypothetical protein
VGGSRVGRGLWGPWRSVLAGGGAAAAVMAAGPLVASLSDESAALLRWMVVALSD